MTLEHSREERQERLFEGGIHTFDLKETVEALRAEPVFDVNGRAGTTLVKNADLRLVVQVLREGAGLAEHHAPGPITVQVLEGELRFAAQEQVFYLKRGEVLAVPSGVPHSVEAVKDAAFLLTIAPQAK